MQPKFENLNVKARCPDCGAVTTFEHRDASHEFGHVLLDRQHQFGGRTFNRIIYLLMRCANCGRGGLAKVHDNGQTATGELESFLPTPTDYLGIPQGVPDGIAAEFREAELCAGVGAWRGSSALFRSTLEKTLKANGYMKGNLEDKVDEAAREGVITAALQNRAHEDVRVLGNDVLHEEWRAITPEETEASHRYTQRILEAFYDDRLVVERLLKQKGRTP